MRPIGYFVPGEPERDKEVLARLRWPIPGGVARAYVLAYTEPGDVVLEPFCQGPAVVREVMAEARRVLALNFDPSLVLLVRSALAPLPAHELDAAVTRLGDYLKQGQPLRRYLMDLYATTCPACQHPVVADYFVWDRERGEPVIKYLRCPTCGREGEAAVEAEDRDRLAQVPRRAMHYHYVLDRLAPQPEDDLLRGRMESLLQLYTPRNLYALAELTLKIEALYPEGPVRQALMALLLDCLDRSSSLTPVPRSTARQRGLARPNRYLERNVWLTFEEAVGRLKAMAVRPSPNLADSIEAFQSSTRESDAFIGPGLVRDLARLLPPRSLRLILTSPPPLDSAAWSLAYMWGAWTLGREAVGSLRPLFRQRTPDPMWYARVMSGSLRSLAELLSDEGRLVLVLSRQRTEVVEALLLAASKARLGVVALFQQGADYRLELTPTFGPALLAQLAQPSAPALEGEIRRVALEAALEVIRARGEPTAWRAVHAAIQQRLALSGLLVRVLESDAGAVSPLDLLRSQVTEALREPVLQALPGVREDDTLWWLSEPSDLPPPLCDRVEEAAHQVLQDNLLLAETGFAAQVCARFPGPLTPEAALIAVCLRSYGREITAGHWQVRPEDLPAARTEERKAIIQDLLSLGQRLGYEPAPCEPFDAAWLQGGEVRALFVVRWRAALSEALALSPQVEAAVPYLVIPGGRAELVSYKLAHNPLWQRTVEQVGWRFIKYRHLRQLKSEPEVNEYILRTVVGLDPIVEREAGQIPLF